MDRGKRNIPWDKAEEATTGSPLGRAKIELAQRLQRLEDRAQNGSTKRDRYVAAMQMEQVQREYQELREFESDVAYVDSQPNYEAGMLDLGIEATLGPIVEKFRPTYMNLREAGRLPLPSFFKSVPEALRNAAQGAGIGKFLTTAGPSVGRLGLGGTGMVATMPFMSGDHDPNMVIDRATGRKAYLSDLPEEEQQWHQEQRMRRHAPPVGDK